MQEGPGRVAADQDALLGKGDVREAGPWPG